MKVRALMTAAVAAVSLAFVLGSVSGSEAAAKKAAPVDPARVFACPLNYDPVCGILNKKPATFSNACHAKQAGVAKFKKGACKK